MGASTQASVPSSSKWRVSSTTTTLPRALGGMGDGLRGSRPSPEASPHPLVPRPCGPGAVKTEASGGASHSAGRVGLGLELSRPLLPLFLLLPGATRVFRWHSDPMAKGVSRGSVKGHFGGILNPYNVH